MWTYSPRTAPQPSLAITPSFSATDTFAWNEFSRVTVDGQRRYRAVKEYHVDLVQDTTQEANETFTVTLAYSRSGQDNLLEGDLIATVAIIEDVTSTVDLQLTGSASSTRISEGGNLTYEYSIRNGGPALATGVTLISNLDPNLTFDSTDSPGRCSHSGESTGGRVTCTLADLTSGQTHIHLRDDNSRLRAGGREQSSGLVSAPPPLTACREIISRTCILRDRVLTLPHRHRPRRRSRLLLREEETTTTRTTNTNTGGGGGGGGGFAVVAPRQPPKACE